MTSRLSDIGRTLKIDLEDHNAAFLWGPRKVGKTTLRRQQFPRAAWFDLLDSKLRTELMLRPATLRDRLSALPFASTTRSWTTPCSVSACRPGARRASAA